MGLSGSGFCVGQIERILQISAAGPLEVAGQGRKILHHEI